MPGVGSRILDFIAFYFNLGLSDNQKLRSMKNGILLLCLFLTSFLGTAQLVLMKGTVSDSSGPLPGANVVVMGTEKSTQTDFDGNFTIEVQKGDKLEVSYIGFRTKIVRIEDVSKDLHIVLEEEAAHLDEVVVMGYATKREAKALGYAVTSVAEAVEGRVAGVAISNGIQPGTLTAGEINDLVKLKEWKKSLKSSDFKDEPEKWGYYLTQEIKVKVHCKNGSPINNVPVALYEEESNQPIQVIRTDIFGEAVLFRSYNKESNQKHHYIQIQSNGGIVGKKITAQTKRVSFTVEKVSPLNNVDIMFTIDATGSMGDEMNYLKSELDYIIEKIDGSVGKKRVALTFYRDFGDDFVVRSFDFNEDIPVVRRHLEAQSANGGGDYEEAVPEALVASLSQSWNENSRTKLMFLLLDAPPHLNDGNVQIINEQIKDASKKGIKIIPIVASGANKPLEFLMRSMSIATNGTYVFLTDDSGVGNPHLSPTTDSFEVEKLNDLIVRLVEKYAGV